MTTKQPDYNGWSNRATWNVNLWLSNDYGHYQAVNDMAAHVVGAPTLAKRIEEYCREVWPTGATPDACPLSEVDWVEIATSWLAD